jgi:transcriptional regulator with XRE-family HTH domain
VSSGLCWSEALIRQLEDPEERNEYVAALVRARLATLIRSLRAERGLSQKQFAEEIGTTQSVISRIEDPEYGKLSLQTVFEVAAALGLPVFIDLPEWEDWFRMMEHGSPMTLHRRSFDAKRLIDAAHEPAPHRHLTTPEDAPAQARANTGPMIVYGDPSEPFASAASAEPGVLKMGQGQDQRARQYGYTEQGSVGLASLLEA